MFTKPAGDDKPSTLVGIVDAGAKRVSAVERVAGFKLGGGSLVVFGLTGFFVMQTLIALGSSAERVSMKFSAGLFLLGYGLIYVLGWWQRQREVNGLPYVFADAQDPGIVIHLVRKCMWFVGRWWGRALAMMVWPAIYAALFPMLSSSIPVVIGVCMFLAIWTIGNRLLTR